MGVLRISNDGKEKVYEKMQKMDKCNAEFGIEDDNVNE